jgi:hypothetical protein
VDLALHLRTLSRHRLIVALGLTAAIVLAAMTYVSVGPGGVHYRGQEEWRSVTRLFASPSGVAITPAAGTATVDPTAFALIAAEFANSDAVLQRLRKDRRVSSRGKINGEVEASPLRDDNSNPLPFIEVAGIAPTPTAAQTLAQHAAHAISAYVLQRQQGAPKRKLITLQVVSEPSDPELLQGRPKSRALFVFVGLLSLTLIVVYVLENARGKQDDDSAQSPPGASAGPTPLPVAVVDPQRGRTSVQADEDANADEAAASQQSGDARPRRLPRRSLGADER